MKPNNSLRKKTRVILEVSRTLKGREGGREREHDSGLENEVNNDDPVERPSEAGEDFNPPQEPTGASSHPQRATPNFEKLTEIPWRS